MELNEILMKEDTALKEDAPPIEEEQKEEPKIKLLSIEEIEKEWPNWNKEQRLECCQYQKLTYDFIKKHEDEVNWPAISINPQTLGGEDVFKILDGFPSKISWSSMCINPKPISDTILYNYRSKMLWNIVLGKQHLNLRFLIILSEVYRKTKAPNAKEFWRAVSAIEDIDDEYVDAYKRFIDFHALSGNPHITEKTIKKYLFKLDPKKLMETVKIPPEILAENRRYFENVH